ncbi:rhoptry kinase family protein ROP39 [Besnoitia besnoiti]|uniref:Rhoptry kinase family protein ROP39 n=1 Tax=Besnoitia besnoiti TaxID=94643 RepID=A0A2A9MH53_BESBE|nr:rhoptry kinase family protein ROP39 [Besnoitia besnoiti]PFH37858.1 rhoptry kinase family protein ROP39 [Besnoitia besnoiti]
MSNTVPTTNLTARQPIASLRFRRRFYRPRRLSRCAALLSFLATDVLVRTIGTEAVFAASSTLRITIAPRRHLSDDAYPREEVPVLIPSFSDYVKKTEERQGAPESRLAFLEASGGSPPDSERPNGLPSLLEELMSVYYRNWQTEEDLQTQALLIGSLPQLSIEDDPDPDIPPAGVELVEMGLASAATLRVQHKNIRGTGSKVSGIIRRDKVIGCGAYNIVVAATMAPSSTWSSRIQSWFTSFRRTIRCFAPQAPRLSRGPEEDRIASISPRALAASSSATGSRLATRPERVILRIRMGRRQGFSLEQEQAHANLLVTELLSPETDLMRLFPSSITAETLIDTFHFAVPMLAGQFKGFPNLLARVGHRTLLNYVEIMPLLPTDLFLVIRRFSQSLRTTLVKQVVELAALLRALGLVHRDIKPDNFLFNRDGVMFLADLDSLEKEGANVPCGTFGASDYADPSIFHCFLTDKQRTVRVSFAHDAWSLGVLLFEILCNNYPFPQMSYDNAYESTTGAFLTALAQMPIPQNSRPVIDWHRCRGRPVNRELKELITGLLDLNPRKRPNIADFYKYSRLMNEGRSEILRHRECGYTNSVFV